MIGVGLDLATIPILGRGVGVPAPGDQVVQARYVAAWGDSLTAANPGWPSRLDARRGFIVYYGGIGGQTSAQIRDRVLADTGHKNDACVFWMGRNDPSVPSQVIANVQACVDYIGHNQYVVVSVTPATYETTGTAGRANIDAINAGLLAAHGSHFVDLIPVVCTDVGGVPPASLLLDGDYIHFNQSGYDLIEPEIYAGILRMPAIGADTTPNTFSFTAVTGAEPNQSYGNPNGDVIISGINVATQVTVEGGEVSIGGGPYASSGTIYNGDTIRVRAVAPSTISTTKYVVVTIGTVSATWTIATTATPNLVLDSTFDDITNWNFNSGTVTVAGGKLVFTSSSYGTATQKTAGTTEVGATYRVTFTIDSINAGQIYTRFAGTAGTVRGAPGTYTQDFVASGTTATFVLAANGTGISATVDNFSVRKL